MSSRPSPASNLTGFIAAAASPDARHTERIEQRFVGHDGQIFDLRLRNQHPVERIAMVDSQAARALRVQEADWKLDETLRGHGTGNVGRNRQRARQLPKACLGRQLPDNHQRNACVSSRRRTHSPHAESSSAGSGSKNASVTRARPRSAPTLRPGGTARMPELRHRLTTPGDHDRLASIGLCDQTREVCLGRVNRVNLRHESRLVDLIWSSQRHWPMVNAGVWPPVESPRPIGPRPRARSPNG